MEPFSIIFFWLSSTHLLKPFVLTKIPKLFFEIESFRVGKSLSIEWLVDRVSLEEDSDSYEATEMSMAKQCQTFNVNKKSEGPQF